LRALTNGTPQKRGKKGKRVRERREKEK